MHGLCARTQPDKSAKPEVIPTELDMSGLFGLFLFMGILYAVYYYTIGRIVEGFAPEINLAVIIAIIVSVSYWMYKAQRKRQHLLGVELQRLNDVKLKRQDKNYRYISSSVKREVWRRDQSRCVECGSRRNLEYDHIIPVSEGGSNTARNVQLLCEKCNRSKGVNIQ